MFGLFKDKVNKLIDKRDVLTIKRQRVSDKKNIKNGRIGVKIDNLQKKSWRNQMDATTKIDEINRELERIERNIISEKEYLNSVPTYKPDEIKEAVRESFKTPMPSDFVTGRGNIETKKRYEPCKKEDK